MKPDYKYWEGETTYENVRRLEARIALLEAKVQRVYNAGIKGIGHVGTANYPEREREARRWVQEALQEQGE
jgi:hypothetical protein